VKPLTPLRYPGGKSHLAPFFGELVRANGISDGVYVEPYAGGAGVAVALVLGEYVDAAWINDIDPAIWAFWKAVLDHNGELCKLVARTPLTLKERARQKATYRRGLAAGVLPLGFALFYLNRTNRSGILDGGVIGGQKQKGEWRIDARFNREDLAERIQRIARYRSRFHVANQDAVVFLRCILKRLPRRTLVYLDPPYYEKGKHLYANYYSDSDHRVVAQTVKSITTPWVVSYDDHAQTRRLYSGYKRRQYRLQYTASARRTGSEIMFFAPGLVVPRALPGV